MMGTVKNDAFSALRYRDFRLYLGIRFYFTCAVMLQSTVLGFYIYHQTHSTVAIALMGLSEVIPAIGIALYGGYIADRCEKRKMLLLVMAGVLVAAVGLLMVTHDLLKDWRLLIICLLFFVGAEVHLKITGEKNGLLVGADPDPVGFNR